MKVKCARCGLLTSSEAAGRMVVQAPRKVLSITGYCPEVGDMLCSVCVANARAGTRGAIFSMIPDNHQDLFNRLGL